MQVKTFSSAGPTHEFQSLRWDLAFHGGQIDERSSAAVEFVQAGASKSCLSEYLPEQPDRLKLDGQLTGASVILEKLRSANKVVFETTSLGFVEVLQLLRLAKKAGLAEVDCIYVEPHEYTRDNYLDSSWARDYSLSESRHLEAVRGFLPPMDLPVNDARMVVFLGYDSARLAGAFEQEGEILSWKRRYAVFGIPGFAPGWEMNAMANNIDTLVRNEFESVRYCAASSVSGAYDLLKTVHKEGRQDNPHTVVAPFGTKPHGIAAAMFLVNYSEFQQSSLLYDHPGRMKGRSSKVRRWHMYRINLESEPS